MGRKREFKSEVRQTRVAALHLRGMRQYEIAEFLKVSKQVVSYDLKRIRQDWKELRAAAYDEILARELAKLDQIERQAWEQWLRSCEDVERIEESRNEKGELVGTRVVRIGQAGNPAYLAAVDRAIERRWKLLGFDLETGERPEQTAIVQVVVETHEDVAQFQRLKDIAPRVNFKQVGKTG